MNKMIEAMKKPNSFYLNKTAANDYDYRQWTVGKDGLVGQIPVPHYQGDNAKANICIQGDFTNGPYYVVCSYNNRIIKSWPEKATRQEAQQEAEKIMKDQAIQEEISDIVFKNHMQSNGRR